MGMDWIYNVKEIRTNTIKYTESAINIREMANQW